MISALVLAVLALAHLAPATEVPPERCGAPDPSRAQLSAAAELSFQESVDRREGFRSAMITVNTYFHVVAKSSNEADGYLSDKTIENQLRVLNEDFAPSGFKFDLRNTTRTVNKSWAVSSSLSTNEAAMKRALRQGSYSDLNVYFLTGLNGVLGYCYYPVASPSDSDVSTDGCSILASTVPGGSETGYNLGKTVVHEVGHWLGLFHTFQGGCEDGDEVADTPAQDSPSSGCPINRDSCPGGGPDPIHNYMDYSDDACLDEFTAGQAVRMHSSWETYRA